MANKYIPFGYEVSNGTTIIVEREAEVVRNIYSLYVQGCSLKNISERLNLLTISYAGDGRAWDKNMVKRILENPRYTGEKEYPVIIPKETAELVLKRKGEKYVAPSDSQKKLRDEYREKVRCSVCGSKMMRQHAGGHGKCRLYWKCTNHNCVESRHGLNETILDSLMAQTLNEISLNTDLIDIEVTKGCEKSSEILAANNDVMNLMSNPECETEYALDKIMNLAMRKFAECKKADNSAVTETIKKNLALYAVKPEPDGETIGKIVDKIYISYQKIISVRLINGKEIERKENKYECSVCT